MKGALLKNLFAASLIALFASCTELLDDGRLSEGVIEYEVTYPKIDPGSILIELLPTKMIMKFKDNRFSTELSAGFGMFKMNVLNYSEDHEFVQLVKLINDRVMVKYNEEGALRSLESFPQISIEKTNNKKKIADFECSEAIITVHGDSVEVFTIYYTNEIKLEDPNWFTQFAEIEGVLMEYQVERYNLCTRFTAINVLPQEIEDEAFDIPEEYKTIEESEMDAKLLKIFNDFSE
jgi:GLPGLI family protein